MTETPNSTTDDPIQFICDIASCRAFFPDYNTPPVQIMAEFRDTPIHQSRKVGSWDLQRAVSEKAGLLVGSIRCLLSQHEEEEWTNLIFRFGPKAFVCVNSICAMGFAATSSQAVELIEQFAESYAHIPSLNGSYQLIRSQGQGFECEDVELCGDSLMSEEKLSLHYEGNFMDWHQEFTDTLCNLRYGLAIFEGKPGTGKTSYLRHLIGTLKDTHRFYFIPPCALYILSNHNFISFWAEQRRIHGDRQFVVILEDADDAIMTRGYLNREQVSAILNLTDGMLADFLQLHIICTINCSSTEIDQALLRPGRLHSHRLFERLDYPQACRLAESLGKSLPVVRDYSLAEVFMGEEIKKTTRRSVGFAA